MNYKRAFLSTGLLLSILSFAFSLAITCLFFYVPTYSVTYRLFCITFFLVGTIFSALGRRISLKSPDRSIKHHGWMILIIVLDCIGALLLWIDYSSHSYMISPFFDFVFMGMLLVSAALTTIGYLRKGDLENTRPYQVSVEEPSIKNRKHKFLWIGLIMSASSFGLLSVINITLIMLGVSLSSFFFRILVIAILLAGAVLSAIGLRISLQEQKRYAKNHAWIIPVYILDGVCAVALLMGIIDGTVMFAFVFDLLFMVAFAISAVFTILGYQRPQRGGSDLGTEGNTVLGTSEHSLSLQPLHDRKNKRSYMFAGELIATVLFGVSALFFLSFIERPIWFFNPIILVGLGTSIVATVFATFGIKISLANHRSYWKKRWVILVTFILCCLFASSFLIAIVFFNLFLFSLGSYFILAGFLTSVPFIMIGYVKARSEAVDLDPLQVFAEMAESIAKFDELRKSGVITEEEFEEIKAKHLEKIK